MCLSDNIFEPENDDTKDLVRLKAYAQDLYEELEDMYKQTVQAASYWKHTSLRASGNEAYNLAAEANFICRSFYDQAVNIKAKADELGLLLVKQKHYSMVVSTRIQEVEEKEEKNVVQDGGPIELIGGLRLVNATQSFGVYMNMFDYFSLDESRDPIKFFSDHIEWSRDTTELSAKNLLMCIKEMSLEFQATAYKWYASSVAVARGEDYKCQAYYISQSFNHAAVLLRGEHTGVRLLKLKQLKHSEAAITKMLELGDRQFKQVNEDDMAYLTRAEQDVITKMRKLGVTLFHEGDEVDEDDTEYLSSLTEQAIKLHSCLEVHYRSAMEFASIWKEISVRALVKKDKDYESAAILISQNFYDRAVLIKEKADGLKIFAENVNDQTEAVYSMILEIGEIEEKADVHVAQDGALPKVIRLLKLDGVRMMVFNSFTQDAVNEFIVQSMDQIDNSVSFTESMSMTSAAIAMRSCLKDNYKKVVKIASLWDQVSLLAARSEDYSLARKAYMVSQSYYDVAHLMEAEEVSLEAFETNQDIAAKAGVAKLGEVLTEYEMRENEA